MAANDKHIRQAVPDKTWPAEAAHVQKGYLQNGQISFQSWNMKYIMKLMSPSQSNDQITVDQIVGIPG